MFCKMYNGKRGRKMKETNEVPDLHKAKQTAAYHIKDRVRKWALLSLD